MGFDCINPLSLILYLKGKDSHSQIAVGAMGIGVPLYLGHS